MKVTLKVVSGPAAGKTIEVAAEGVMRFGRTSKADYPLPEDSFLSSLHFAIASDDAGVHLRDLGSSNGTFLNGAKVERATLASGDQIRAGGTTLMVHIESRAAEAAAAVPAMAPGEADAGAMSPQTERLLRILRLQPEPLFAVLDAARCPQLIELLSASGEEFRSMYEGASAVDLALVAPYLVRLPGESGLLEKLAREGWGKSWGIYLTSSLPLADLRHHLRRFLMVQVPGGKWVYFRFFDPRVLRVYLPTCTEQERRDFFGPIGNYLVEGERESTLLSFTAGSKDAVLRALASAAGPSA